MVTGAITDGDQERERERRGLEQVRRCGGERDKDIV
jgi:hypothetical protein